MSTLIHFFSNPGTYLALACTAIIGWIGKTYGKSIVDFLRDEIVLRVLWFRMQNRYMDSLYKAVSRVLILGQHEARQLERLFVDLHLLEDLQIDQTYSASQVDEINREWGRSIFPVRRKEAGDLVVDEVIAKRGRLLLLGQPGSGKTTFLKHTVIRFYRQEIQYVPLFVELKALLKADMSIEKYIANQLRVHGKLNSSFYANRIAERILAGGKFLILLDGLDEVPEINTPNNEVLFELRSLAQRYDKCPIIVTCRTNAVFHKFELFDYAEMARFGEHQIKQFVEYWFKGDADKGAACTRDLFSHENEAIKELAQTPLLCGLLCVVYEDVGSFPLTHASIYKAATEALLRKWDEEKGVERKRLSNFGVTQNRELLSYLAAGSFVEGKYLFPEEELIEQVERWVAHKRRTMTDEEESGFFPPNVTGTKILDHVLPNHGIIEERARDIYTFSHLTLQEYFTALHIVNNKDKGALTELLRYVGDERWNEIFLHVVEMLESDVDAFLDQYLNALHTIISWDKEIAACLVSIEKRRIRHYTNYHQAAMRAFLLRRAWSDAKRLRKEERRRRELTNRKHDASRSHIDSEQVERRYNRIFQEQDIRYAVKLIRLLDYDIARQLEYVLQSMPELSSKLATRIAVGLTSILDDDLGRALDLSTIIDHQLAEDNNFTQALTMLLILTEGLIGSRELSKRVTTNVNMQKAYKFAGMHYDPRIYEHHQQASVQLSMNVSRALARSLVLIYPNITKYCSDKTLTDALEKLRPPDTEESVEDWGAYAAGLKELLQSYDNTRNPCPTPPIPDYRLREIWNWTSNQHRLMERYLSGAYLFARLVTAAQISIEQRQYYLNQLLLPQKHGTTD